MIKCNLRALPGILIIASGAGVYITGLFVDQTGDAAKYMAVARSIVETGDWINLKIHHEPYIQKPPLLFWLTALAFHLGGVSVPVYKIPALLVSVLGLYATYRLGKLFYGSKTGKLAALMLFFSQIFFLYNTDIHTDTLLVSFSVFSLWLFSCYLLNQNILFLIGGFIATGLAMLTKGPVGLAIQVFAIGFHLIYTKNYRQLFIWHWLLGVPILLFMLLPAFIGLYNQFGMDGLIFYFWTNNAGRITGSYIGNNNMDPFFYFHTMLYIFLPWSLFALSALFLEWKDIVAGRRDKTREALLIGGLSLFWIVLSVSRAKAPHYFFITLPFLAILTAKWTLTIFRNTMYCKLRKIIVSSQVFIISGLWICAFIIPACIFTNKSYLYLPILIIPILLQLFLFKYKRGFALLLWTSFLAITAMNYSVNSVMLPGMFNYQSAIKASEKFNKEAASNDILYNFRYDQYEIFYYAKNSSMIDSDEKLNEVLTKDNVWIFTDCEGYHLIESKTAIDTVFTFPHKNLTRPTLKFIWPSTRLSAVEKMYLLKISG